MAAKRKYKGRKTAKRDLSWQSAKAKEIQMKMIGIKLLFEEVPDTHLPQAPLIRGTVDLILDALRKWISRIDKDLEKEKEEIERDAPKKVRSRSKKA